MEISTVGGRWSGAPVLRWRFSNPSILKTGHLRRLSKLVQLAAAPLTPPLRAALMRSIHTIGIDLPLGRDVLRFARERSRRARRGDPRCHARARAGGTGRIIAPKIRPKYRRVAEMLERVSGIEPPSKAWEAGQSACDSKHLRDSSLNLAAKPPREVRLHRPIWRVV
jgi:hypothetical protein